MRARRAAGALALGLFVVTSFAPAAQATRARNACRLLKPSEIAATLAVAAVDYGVKGEIPRTCQWHVDGGPAAGGGLVATALERGGRAKESFELARDLAGGDLVEVDGLGRDAFFAIDAVYVLSSKRTFFFVQALLPEATTTDGTVLQDHLEALAEIAVKRS